jgi:hypothetical protein
MTLSQNSTTSKTNLQRWGGVATFTLLAASLISGLIYLTGNLRAVLGPLSYSIADFLYGPVWGASLVVVVLALQERLGQHAPRRMHLAVVTAVLAAAAFLIVACFRAANRYYHFTHPDLGLESSMLSVMVAWTTLVAGMTGAARHLLGWVLVLIGSAGWTSRSIPRLLSALYFIAGIASMLVFVLPGLGEFVGLPALLVGVWQGILLWRPVPTKRKGRKKSRT